MVYNPTMQNSIVEYMTSESIQSNIKDTLGKHTPQFITSVASLVNSTPALKEADKQSVLLACLTAASLNLPINQNLGFAYIIPYKNKQGVQIAQFQLGYKAFIQLAMRSGQFKTLNTTDVKQDELQRIDRLTGELELIWNTTDKRESLPTVGYLAYFKLLNGFEKSLYMTVAELQKHGMRFSASYRRGYGLWKDDFDSMAKKTVIKQLLSKYAPMNTEMQRAKEADQAVITEDGYEYPDNDQLTIEEEAGLKEKARILAHIVGAQTIAELELCVDGIDQVEGNELFEQYTAKKKLLSKGKKK